MAKKHKCPEFENHERWLVSYADMLTLLFALFVVLYALKEGRQSQVQKTAGSMQESFNTPLEDIPIDRQVGPTEQGFGIFDHFKGEQIRPPLIKKFPSQKQRALVIDEELKRVSVELEERLYGPDKFRTQKKPGLARVVSVDKTEKGFKLRLMGRYFYTKGSSKVKKSTLPILDQVIEVLKSLGRSITIEGHTDSLSQDEGVNNWEVSALRASYVARYMLSKHQFPQSRLSVAGYADTRPLAHNGSEQGRRLNRRIEIHVHYDPNSPYSP